MRGARPTIYRLPGGQRERAAPSAADEDRQMRLLHRLGLGVVVGDRVVVASEAERSIAEATLEHRDRLDQPLLAGRCRVEWQADRLVLRTVPAGPDGHVEPAFAEDVQAGQILRQDCRMAQVVVQHEGADPQPIGDGGDDRHGGHRSKLRDQVIRDDERIDPDRLRAAGRLGELASGGDAARISKESEWLHRAIVAQLTDPGRGAPRPGPARPPGRCRLRLRWLPAVPPEATGDRPACADAHAPRG